MMRGKDGERGKSEGDGVLWRKKEEQNAGDEKYKIVALFFSWRNNTHFNIYDSKLITKLINLNKQYYSTILLTLQISKF